MDLPDVPSASARRLGIVGSRLRYCARLLVHGLTLVWPVVPALAQTAPPPTPIRDTTWAETSTGHFIVLSGPTDGAARDYYASRADGIYSALAAVFGATLETPITLRLFASSEAFRAANPLAVEVDGAVLAGRRGRRDIDIDVPHAVGDVPPGTAPHPGLDNALRREVAFRLAGALSDDRLPAGFRAGIAQYFEQPGDRRAAGVARLREAWREARLPSWSDLNAPGAAFSDPPLAYPQNLSIIHFLVATDGLAELIDFMRASTRAPGWRDALEGAYGRPPVAIEAAWRDRLPAYLDGGWRYHTLYNQDLGLAETMLAQGDFDGVVAHLAGVLSLATGTDSADADDARQLLARAETGQAARSDLALAATGLAAGDYVTARARAIAATRGFDSFGDAAGGDRARQVAARAATGLAAAAALARAERLPAWRAIEARHTAYQAAVGFGQVGNETAAARARARVAALDRRLAPAGGWLLGLGAGLLAWNSRRRWKDRRAAAARPRAGLFVGPAVPPPIAARRGSP